MRYKVNYADFSYEAHFGSPFFAVAMSPGVVLTAVHKQLSPKYVIPTRDLTVDSARAVGDIRAKISLFGGRGTLEVSTDVFAARFNEPRTTNDFDVIRDCIQLTHDALLSWNTTAYTVVFREEAINLRMFLELGSDAHEFLRNVVPRSEIYPSDEGDSKAEVIPGFHSELVRSDEKWDFSLGVQRAARSRSELFVVGNMRFYDGGRYATLNEKAEHYATIMKAEVARLKLEPEA